MSSSNRLLNSVCHNTDGHWDSSIQMVYSCWSYVSLTIHSDIPFYAKSMSKPSISTEGNCSTDPVTCSCNKLTVLLLLWLILTWSLFVPYKPLFVANHRNSIGDSLSIPLPSIIRHCSVVRFTTRAQQSKDLRNCWPFTSFIAGWLSHVHTFVMPHHLLDLQSLFFLFFINWLWLNPFFWPKINRKIQDWILTYTTHKC